MSHQLNRLSNNTEQTLSQKQENSQTVSTTETSIYNMCQNTCMFILILVITYTCVTVER